MMPKRDVPILCMMMAQQVCGERRRSKVVNYILIDQNQGMVLYKSFTTTWPTSYN
jgi:hypothetical protein